MAVISSLSLACHSLAKGYRSQHLHAPATTRIGARLWYPHSPRQRECLGH